MQDLSVDMYHPYSPQLLKTSLRALKNKQFDELSVYQVSFAWPLTHIQNTHTRKHTNFAVTFGRFHCNLPDPINISISVSSKSASFIKENNSANGWKLRVQMPRAGMNYSKLSEKSDASRFHVFCLQNSSNSTWHRFHKGWWKLSSEVSRPYPDLPPAHTECKFQSKGVGL